MSKGWSAFLILVCLIPAGIWSSFVASTIWRWFAVPIGAPVLTVTRTMGLAILIGMYRYAGETRTQDTQEKSGGELFVAFLARAGLIPAFALLLGWIYRSFL